MFQEGIYLAKEGDVHQITDLITALPVCVEADKIAASLRRDKREPTDEESKVLARAEALRDVLIQVDVFEDFGLSAQENQPRPALLGTEERLANLERKSYAA